MQQIKLLTLLALLGHLSLDPSSPSPAVASAANNRRFTDYSDPSAARSSQPQDASGASDPSAWIRSAGAQDFTSRRRGSSLLPGFPSAGSGADPFSTWNQYMYEMVRNMMPFGGGMDASSWFAGEDEDAGTAGADGGGGSGKSAIMRLPPGVHARETEAERLFFMDLPGFHRSEVTVEVVAGHLLSIRAERKCDPSDAYCTSRSIKHKLELDPDTIDTRKISVNLDAGELRIHLPKRSATRFSIPVIDSLFGLNQPGASDTAGDKVKIAKIKSDDQPAEGLAGAIHWPGMSETAPGIVGTVKEWYESAKDTAGNVVESAESVAQRAKQAAFGSAEHVASEGGRAVQDAANYARRAVHHTTDTAQDALGRTAQGARENVEYAANVAGQARDTAYGAAQDAASQARGAAQGAASQARGSAQHVANQVRGTAEQAQAQAHDASNYASNLANQVRDTAYGKAQEAAESMYGAYGSAADSLNQAAGAASDASLRAAQAASETAAKARDAAADTAASAYDSAAASVQHAKRAAGDAAESVQAKAGDAVDAAKDTATSLKQAVERNVVEPVESAAEAAAHKAGEALDATRHKAGEVVDGARHKAGSWFGFFQDVGAGAKEAAVEGSEGVKEGWEKGTTESRIKRQAAGK